MDENKLKDQIKFIFSKVFPLSGSAFYALVGVFTNKVLG